MYRVIVGTFGSVVKRRFYRDISSTSTFSAHIVASLDKALYRGRPIRRPHKIEKSDLHLSKKCPHWLNPPLSVQYTIIFKKSEDFAPKITDVCIWRIPLSEKCPHWTNLFSCLRTSYMNSPLWQLSLLAVGSNEQQINWEKDQRITRRTWNSATFNRVRIRPKISRIIPRKGLGNTTITIFDSNIVLHADILLSYLLRIHMNVKIDSTKYN